MFRAETRSGAIRAAGQLLQQQEAGVRYPSWFQLCRISEITGLAVGALLDGADVPQPQAADDDGQDRRVAEIIRSRYQPALVRHVTAAAAGEAGEITNDEEFKKGMTAALRTATFGACQQELVGVTIAEALSDVEMGRRPEVRILRIRYAREINNFQRSLRIELDRRNAAVSKQARGGRRPPFRWRWPSPGFTIPHAANDTALFLTVDGGIVQEFGPDTRCTALVFSLSAHHPEHGRAPIPEDECL